MSSLPIKLKSGAVLAVGIAPFSDATKLFKTVANELKKVEVNLTSIDMKNIMSNDINSIKNLIFQILGSDEMEECFFKCAIRSTINGAKVQPSSFESEDARGDYLPVAWEVIKANLSPFFKNLDLSSLTSGPEDTKSQKLR